MGKGALRPFVLLTSPFHKLYFQIIYLLFLFKKKQASKTCFISSFIFSYFTNSIISLSLLDNNLETNSKLIPFESNPWIICFISWFFCSTSLFAFSTCLLASSTCLLAFSFFSRASSFSLRAASFSLRATWYYVKKKDS